jgi:SAM-dependent methyltransferase
MNAEKQKHWNEVYSGVGALKVSWFQQQASTSLKLIRNAGASERSAIIDVGGGASVLVDQLLEDGFRDVSVLDISEVALAASRERLGDRAALAQWIVADVLSWIPQREYDLWHDRAVFHFLTDAQDRARYGAVLAKALRQGGTLIIGTFAEDGPERCSGLPVQRWSADALSAELGQSYVLKESLKQPHRTPKGAVQAFTWARFQRL